MRRNKSIFMTRNFRSALAGVSLLLAILACDLSFEQVAPPGEVQTAAALTVQAALTTPSITSTTSTLTMSPSSTAETPSPTGLPNGSATITPTFSVPMLTVLEDTNCRTGPGEEYEVIFTYLAGKDLEIAGRYDPGNFWLVKSNESPTGTCWLWGEFVEVTGSYSTVPSVTPPPTATLAPPRQPGVEKWEFFCNNGTLNFTVNWADNATNETGYRIFRNGEQIAELPANSITFTDAFAISVDQSVEYYVQVFAPSGTANTSIMRMRC
jgi:hypothetical protein